MQSPTEDEDSNFYQDPQVDGECDDNLETDIIITLDDHGDGTIGGDDDGDSDGDDDDDGSEVEVVEDDDNGSEIEVVKDGKMKIKPRLGAPATAAQKDLPNTNVEESSGSDEDGA